MATGKLLHISIRNKFCQACNQGKVVTKPAPYNSLQVYFLCYFFARHPRPVTSTGMDLRGPWNQTFFLGAENTHGLRYMRIIGDGDSNVYPTLQQSVPVRGRDIQKLECANHACKCYRGAQNLQVRPRNEANSFYYQCNYWHGYHTGTLVNVYSKQLL